MEVGNEDQNELLGSDCSSRLRRDKLRPACARRLPDRKARKYDRAHHARTESGAW